MEQLVQTASLGLDKLDALDLRAQLVRKVTLQIPAQLEILVSPDRLELILMSPDRLALVAHNPL